jgi:hypothetical protein
MLDPGLDRHDWESQWASLEEDLHDSPLETLPEVERLLAQMLDEAGFDPELPAQADEPEVLGAFRAGRALRLQAESDAGGPGDVAAAVNAFQSVYEALIDQPEL